MTSRWRRLRPLEPIGDRREDEACERHCFLLGENRWIGYLLIADRVFERLPLLDLSSLWITYNG